MKGVLFVQPNRNVSGRNGHEYGRSLVMWPNGKDSVMTRDGNQVAVLNIVLMQYFINIVWLFYSTN